MLQQIYPSPEHQWRYELHKDFQFAAAHYVPHADAGACQFIHGHTYFVDITVVGNDLGEDGFLVNFQDLKKLVHNRYDHKIINEVEFLGGDKDKPKPMATTEVMAQEIWHIVQTHLFTTKNQPLCTQVYLRETPTSYVVFRPLEQDMDELGGLPF